MIHGKSGSFPQLLLILALALSIVRGHAVMAQSSSSWVRTNPGGGGMFNHAAAGPDGLLIVTSDLSGPYVSRDHGTHWTPLGPANGITNTHASAIGFHRLNPAIVSVGSEVGIFRSSDGAYSFQQVLPRGYVHDIQFSALMPDRGFATVHSHWDKADGQIYRSIDAGLSWTLVSTNLPAGLRLLKLVLSPYDAQLLYAIAGNGRFAQGPQQIFMSSDGGVTWTRLTGMAGTVDLGSSPLMDIAFHPTNPAIRYLTRFSTGSGDYGATFISHDNGVSWQQTDSRGGVFFTDPARPNLVRRLDPSYQNPWDDGRYGPALNGLFESLDAGLYWTRIDSYASWDRGWHSRQAFGSTKDGPVATLGSDLSNPDAIYWVTTQAIFGSSDGGRRFAPLHTRPVGAGWQSTGIDNVVMHQLVPSESDPRWLYVAFDDLGCWRTRDAGQIWENCNPINASFNHWTDTNGQPYLAAGGENRSLVVDPANPALVWGIFENPGRSYVLKNTGANAQESWIDASLGLPGSDLGGLSMAPGGSVGQRTLYTTAAGRVYRSSDDGASWTLRDSPDSTGRRITAVDRFNANLVYAGGEAGLFVSIDAGASWVSVNVGEQLGGSVAGMPDKRGWEGVATIVPDPNVTGQVYVAVHGVGRGLWRGTLTGSSWQWVKLLTDDYLRSVAVTPGNGRILYTAFSSAYTSGGYNANARGVLRSTDGGASWVSINEGMTWPLALTIAIIPGDPGLVYVGSPGTGIAMRRFDAIAPTATATATATATPTSMPSAQPVLVAPQGTIPTSTPTFVWDGVIGATSYRLWVNEYADPNIPGKINQVYTASAVGCTNGGRCNVSPGVSFAAVTSQWWITAIMPDGSERLSDSAFFTVQPAATATATNTATATATRTATATATHTATATATNTATATATNTATATATNTATATATNTATATATRTATATATRTATATATATATRTPTATALQKPALISPRGVITTSKPSFVWNGVPGAVSYRLWVNEYANPNIPGKINKVYTASAAGCASGGRCQVSPGVRFASASAEWWITAIMPDGSQRLSDSALFTVQP